MSFLRRLGLAVALMMTLAMQARGERAAVSDSEMQQGLLEMLARFSEYMVGIWQPCQEPNGVGETCGAFRANSALQSNEDGVRTNADLSMVCAFLVRYAQGRVGLPAGITWAQLDSMAIRSLRFAYSTHKAVRLKRCADGRYWGSMSASASVTLMVCEALYATQFHPLFSVMGFSCGLTFRPVRAMARASFILT